MEIETHSERGRKRGNKINGTETKTGREKKGRGEGQQKKEGEKDEKKMRRKERRDERGRGSSQAARERDIYIQKPCYVTYPKLR